MTYFAAVPPGQIVIRPNLYWPYLFAAHNVGGPSEAQGCSEGGRVRVRLVCF
ncbi:MAG: hypothetical protein LC772_09030 [Chloroflexi bacterium]|nr:hypothetical protein [Chloroflexota bacterium]